MAAAIRRSNPAPTQYRKPESAHPWPLVRLPLSALDSLHFLCFALQQGDHINKESPMPRHKSAKTSEPPATTSAPEPERAPGNEQAGTTTAQPAKRKLADPFSIARDYQAGVELLESRRFRQMQIKFDKKPFTAVLDAIRAEGYGWRNQDKAWTKQMSQETAMQTRIDAERLYQQVADMLCQEKGIRTR
jgi:hypothetical protein